MIGISIRIKSLKWIGVLLSILLLIGGGIYFTIRWTVLVSSDETLDEAERCLRQRNNAGVRESLKWLLWFQPTHHRALLIHGISLNADRKFSEAIQVLERIPETSVSFEDVSIALASSLVHDEQLDRGAAVLQRHLRLFPESVTAYEELVKLNIRLLRQREAISLLLEFGKNGWDDFGALPLLLKLEVTPLTPHEIVASLEATNQKHPRQPMVLLALARATSMLGKTEQAQTCFDEALRLAPDDFLTHVVAAEFHLNRGDVERARQLLSSDAVMRVDDDRRWYLLCRIAEQSGQVAEAHSHLSKALAFRPNDETYVLMNATLLRRLVRTDESRAAALRATELAEARKRLLVLSSQFDRSQPSAELCLEIAEQLERWGQQEQAAAWRRSSEFISSMRPAETVP